MGYYYYGRTPSQRVTVLGSGLDAIPWLLRDEFWDTRAAGAVNNTPATPGPGTRVATDANSKLTIGSGVANYATGGVGVGNPGLWWDVQARAAGRVFLASITPSGVVNAHAGVGWDANQAGALTDSLNFAAGGVLQFVANGAAAYTVGAFTATAYKVAMIHRAAGMYVFVKGGAFTTWTLIAISAAGNAAAYPGIGALGATSVFTADFARGPVATYLPPLLAYDTFTRADGALGSTETAGSEAQVVTARTWTGGANWAVATGEAVNSPVAGAELVVNGTMEAGDPPTDWQMSGTPTTFESSGVQVHLGAASCHIVVDAQFEGCSNITRWNTVAGRWVQARMWLYGNNRALWSRCHNGSAILEWGASVVGAAWTERVVTYRELADGVGNGYIQVLSHIGVVDADFYVDDMSFKVLTLTDLITRVETSTANVVAQVELDTVVANTQAGMVLNLDSEAAPANFVLAFHDGTNARLTKCVAGVYTSVISAAATYAAGAILQVVKDGTAYSLYYNGAAVGTTQTIADAGIISNTMHGMFSTFLGNQMDQFLIAPRGTGGEYSALDIYGAAT